MIDGMERLWSMMHETMLLSQMPTYLILSHIGPRAFVLEAKLRMVKKKKKMCFRESMVPRAHSTNPMFMTSVNYEAQSC